MSGDKKVKDLIIDAFEYPHVPYWFTIKQAIMVIKKSAVGTEKLAPTVLVFDEKYNLMGTLTTREILIGLEPALSKPEAIAEGVAGMFGEESKKRAERPVSEVMIPVRYFVEPDDPITKAAAYLMIHHDLILLPVVKEKKLVGVVRMTEIFNELSSAIL